MDDAVGDVVDDDADRTVVDAVVDAVVDDAVTRASSRPSTSTSSTPEPARKNFDASFREFVVTKLQARARGKSKRDAYARVQRAVRCIQARWRESERRAAARPDYHAMASRIARAWRRHLRIRVFRRLRDLVASNNEKSDPASALRRVNPAEAAVAGDPSCGTHVRFRLGGETFPPEVVYKIYTHRPVTDVCAFAPRDYAASRAAAAGSRDRSSERPSRRGWYARVENNAWRPVRDVGALEERENETTASARRESIRDAYTFHLSPSARRDATERRRRERRVEWMRKLYGFQAMRRGGGGGSDAGAGAPRGSGSTRVDADGDDLDLDVDATFAQTDEERALLSWSSALDFDAYQRMWSTLSCGAPSESTAPRGIGETAIEASARLGLSDANAFGGYFE